MKVISKVLASKRSNCALIPFITAGYPSLEISVQALYALDAQGADIIELGIPYSDALADGPIIQESSKVALKQGIYVDQVLDILTQVQAKLNAPIVIFTYYNPILARGIGKFIKEISAYGAKGLIIPDLPLEEMDYLIELCNKFYIELILFISPTSSKSRIASILTKSPGCIYLVSSNGVTGEREQFAAQVNQLANYIKQNTSKLVMLGFGISSPEQVTQVSRWNVDGIVMGSAFIKAMSCSHQSQVIPSLHHFCKRIRSAIDI